ncbi:MAG: thiamine-phosphate diphosphorylase [Spirochaetes bacterium GWF1_51_8]|nr:MAG: thiamine-phosphate diphosphorylase [Spirochaetes bacterium GWF1_51_8]
MNRKSLPDGIYGLTAEIYSHGRKNTDVVRAMIAGGVSIVQYREKENKTPREKLAECNEIRRMTRDAGVMFIVNDDIEIAILCGADGIHVGQDDLSVADVRKLAGDAMIVGLSTHTPEQAQDALKTGADYIGVGPLFETHTKVNVIAPVGLSYLEYVEANIDLPYVAIGGIKLHNIGEVLSRGARTVALVTEIVGADDIEGMTRRIASKFEQAGIPLRR